MFFLLRVLEMECPTSVPPQGLTPGLVYILIFGGKYAINLEKEGERERNLDSKILKESCGGGWRDGSGVKSTGCSSRGPEFKSQQPHSG